MNKSDKEIDDLIHQALSKEEAAYFDEMGEQNIPGQILSLFKGRNKWMNVLMVFMNLVIFAVAIYTFTNMLNAEVMMEKVEWMFYSLIGFMAMMMMKLWSWNQMDKNALMREIKRLEYQVSLLKGKE
ncbi:hypothetical protein BFP97_02385 [Roseivirga sp. 4D4]|uniref:DUF6768 family protein n=1 Tax=Roseivirga sp. 4D4 TaxID=1889784 RepID=UPI0008530EA9|nr:DUF6768 family protein [Roseivirga sp. 4D4]OEK00427.1 hypothetical protein BFP97_02385 [Roseivirga sp. 4D4]